MSPEEPHMTAAAWICLLSPLAAALGITLAGTSITRRAAGYVATASVGISFLAALVTFFGLTDRGEEEREEVSTLWTWLSAGELEFGLSILVDPLSVFMMLVVAGVGFLIVGYSIGYMDGEDEERRFFAYMALFVFSMLLLVQSSNFLILLVGWGLVGLCSYLLIGYYHERPSAVRAAKKAFIMNAFGDATMALALFLLIWETGSTSLEFGVVPEDGTIATLVALGLLGGAVAKSAQVPLHTWLPDAMEGPTPVSALIHAATMVVAGVYMLVRLSAVFEAAPEVQDLAAGLGAITLLLAGLVALVQTDIKRVIAYSTMSQIGYMFLGARCGCVRSAALRRRDDRRVPDRALHIPDDLHRLRRRSDAVRARALPPPRDRWRRPVLDDLNGRRAGNPLGRRRLAPVRGALASPLGLPRSGCRVADRANRDAGSRDEHPRGRTRARRNAARLAALRRPSGPCAGGAVLAHAARAQVLLRRGVRLRLLPADVGGRTLPDSLRRASSRPRRGRRRRDRQPDP